MTPLAIPNNFEGRKSNTAQKEGDTHESGQVSGWVTSNVFPQFPTGNPRGNELEGFESDTEERNYVWMCQMFPRDSLAAEKLSVRSLGKNGESTALMAYLPNPRGIFSAVGP